MGMNVTVFEKMLRVWRLVLGRRTTFSQKARSYPICYQVHGSHSIGLFYNRKSRIIARLVHVNIFWWQMESTGPCQEMPSLTVINATVT